ncbi:hypothetical protein ANCCAN_19357 [Ancylostoma caninum]|uniref:Uncharacterized protein n=1 Tax=Ancylostoma caninum TaxID=29170 RepID=A0A368FTJ1_ANCCA|nr:hypothetical protein ANCCAN_19357 [Ancylostoma caninum]
MNIAVDSDLNERTYACCCGAIRIKNGAYGVAIFYAMIILSNLGIRLYKSNEVQWNWQLLFLVSDTVAVLCLVYGLAREQAAFLQPFTIISIVTVSFCVLLTAFYASAVYDPTSYAGEQIEILLAGKVKSISEYFHTTTRTVITLVALIGAMVYGVTVVIHSWFMIIVVRCAQYFREEQSIEVKF